MDSARPVSGLVLGLRPLGESDLLVDLFTRELGRVTALAKGARRSRKRFVGVLLSAQLLETRLSPSRKSELWRLEEAALGQRFLGLRLDWRRWVMAGPVLELLLRATPPLEPLPQALELALHTLDRMQRAEDSAEMGSALLIFLTRLLSLLGYGLHLNSCLRCGTPLEQAKGRRLSLAGGLLCGGCPTCQGDMGADLGLCKGLAAAQSLPYPALGRLRFPPSQLSAGLDYLAEFWRRVLVHDLPSMEVAGQGMAAA